MAAARATADDPQAQAAVALVLARLAPPPHTEAVAAGSATPVLIGSLFLQGGGAEVTLAAAAALQHLVGTAKGHADLTAGGIAPCVRLLQPSALTMPPVEQAALHLHALAVLEALAVEPGGGAAVAAAAPWASLTQLIAGGAGGHSAADVPPIALRLAHALATDGACCRTQP